MYDYGGCIFPEGVLDSKTAVGFNHSDIEKIIHMGLEDDKEFKDLNDALNKFGDDMRKEFTNIFINKQENKE